MGILDKTREAVGDAAASVTGAMRVAVVSCVLSVLAIVIALFTAIGHVSRETAAAGG